MVEFTNYHEVLWLGPLIPRKELHHDFVLLLLLSYVNILENALGLQQVGGV